ncbi:glycosyltransferase [Oceanihabitans sp. 2_MG-2023]|uniref:glycosyltransferase n=1 Tax=Oceanihabitans sp. 2_MG-2023 TaxID=3062661 RepID=UPI0026E2F1B3|nr:glycosyltransferase [Oceanihabitans sp. 2_MG-2023]MDO6597686.1 glycosyltransferase [Oceanihabitans sp. 2_MG-2023]
MSKQDKHIAIVVKYFPTVSETFIVNQINGLLDAGCKVDLYAYVAIENALIHKSLKKYNLLEKVKYFISPPTLKRKRFIVFLNWIFENFFSIKWNLLFKTLHFFKYGKEAYTLKLFFEAQWFLVPNTVDIIHTHFGMTGNRIAKLKAIGIIPSSVKLINTFHGYDLSPEKLPLYKKKYHDLFHQADVFTVNTPYLEGVLKQVNTNNKPCYILPVGLDTSYFKKEQEKENTGFFDIVFCGRLIPLKAPDLAVAIIKQVILAGYHNVRLHIIGDGPMKAQLQETIKENKLKEYVSIYGQLSQEAIKQKMQLSDMFLLPGRYEAHTGRAETQGLVIQEAQAMCLPVIVSDVGGMQYGVLPNKTGYIIAENDINGFVTAIEQLILKPDLKVELGNNGRDFVVKNYDNKVLTDALLVIYDKII